MLPGLHTRHDKPDWEYVSPGKRSVSQRIAARTRGVITPANIVSVIGLALVVWGVALLGHGSYILGVLLIIGGRLADIADGFIAERTRTKSRLGEIMDIVIDKLTAVIVLVYAIINFSIPVYVLTFVILQNVLSSLAGLYIHFKSLDLHTTRLGKTATGLTWAVMIVFILLEHYDNSVVAAGAYGAFGAYLTVGILSLQEYYSKIIAAKKG